jgi:hypothetical protein
LRRVKGLLLSKSNSVFLIEPDGSVPRRSAGIQNWRAAQAEHNERMAKLSDAYAAAYEGDVQFAAGPGQRSYLVQRARRHRRDAQLRRAAAQDLRSIARPDPT